MKISRALVNSCVQRRQNLVATFTISCALDHCLLFVVEKAPQFDGFVEPFIVELRLGHRTEWDLLHTD